MPALIRVRKRIGLKLILIEPLEVHENEEESKGHFRMPVNLQGETPSADWHLFQTRLARAGALLSFPLAFEDDRSRGTGRIVHAQDNARKIGGSGSNFGFEREEGLHHQASWLYPIRYFQEAGGAPRVIVCSKSAAMSCRIRSAAGWPCNLVNRPLVIRACTANSPAPRIFHTVSLASW